MDTDIKNVIGLVVLFMVVAAIHFVITRLFTRKPTRTEAHRRICSKFRNYNLYI